MDIIFKNEKGEVVVVPSATPFDNPLARETLVKGQFEYLGFRWGRDITESWGGDYDDRRPMSGGGSSVIVGSMTDSQREALSRLYREFLWDEGYFCPKDKDIVVLFPNTPAQRIFVVRGDNREAFIERQCLTGDETVGMGKLSPFFKNAQPNKNVEIHVKNSAKIVGEYRQEEKIVFEGVEYSFEYRIRLGIVAGRPPMPVDAYLVNEVKAGQDAYNVVHASAIKFVSGRNHNETLIDLYYGGLTETVIAVIDAFASIGFKNYRLMRYDSANREYSPLVRTLDAPPPKFVPRRLNS